MITALKRPYNGDGRCFFGPKGSRSALFSPQGKPAASDLEILGIIVLDQ